MKILNELPPEPKKGELICMDVETFGQIEGKLHRPNGTFACISVNLQRDPETVYQLYDQHDLRKLVKIAKPGTWVFHNSLYDLRQMLRYTSIAPRYIHDTMLMEQALKGGYYLTFGLADLTRRYLGEYMDKEAREEFSTRTEMTPKIKTYAAKDVVKTIRIAMAQIRTYANDSGLKAYTVADEPMIWPVLDLQGFRVDVKGWEKMVKGFEAEATRLEQELGFNTMSGDQVKAACKKVGIHLQSTGADVLLEYAGTPIIDTILLARRYRKAKSTYGMRWLEENVESDGKVYADYHITGASMTGRMSCSSPNLQNIPQRKLPIYRERFLASEGYVLDISDVKQQEPCCLAWHTQDARLLKAIKSKEDLHLAVARNIFHDPTLTKENAGDKRAVGKQINLGTSYGLTAYGLAAKLNIDVPVAEGFLKQYFQTYSGVFAWIQQQRRSGFQKGFVTTALGRRSYLNLYDRGWENNAINSPIQGGAAELHKVWSRKVWEMCKRQGVPYTTVAWVHDETVRDIPKEVYKESMKIQHEAFQYAAQKLYPGVPFEIECEAGRSWAAKTLSTEVMELED